MRPWVNAWEDITNRCTKITQDAIFSVIRDTITKGVMNGLPHLAATIVRRQVEKDTFPTEDRQLVVNDEQDHVVLPNWLILAVIGDMRQERKTKKVTRAVMEQTNLAMAAFRPSAGAWQDDDEEEDQAVESGAEPVVDYKLHLQSTDSWALSRVVADLNNLELQKCENTSTALLNQHNPYGQNAPLHAEYTDVCVGNV